MAELADAHDSKSCARKACRFDPDQRHCVLFGHMTRDSPAAAGRQAYIYILRYMIFYVYILKSSIDFGYYIGQTKNLDKRIEKHNLGLVKSTKYRKPLKLVYSEKYNNRHDAIMREKLSKRQKGGDVFKKIINHDAG